MGYRRLLLLCNAIIVVYCIPNIFVSSSALWYLAISRAIYGFVASVMVNATAAMIGDSIPKEYQMTVGSVINTGIVSGLFITACFGLFVPTIHFTTDLTSQKYLDEVAAVTEDNLYWRLSYSLPMISAVV